jgi:hypothetical protein
VVKNDFLNNP